jgi:hypothetical protein
VFTPSSVAATRSHPALLHRSIFTAAARSYHNSSEPSPSPVAICHLPARRTAPPAMLLTASSLPLLFEDLPVLLYLGKKKNERREMKEKKKRQKKEMKNLMG